MIMAGLPKKYFKMFPGKLKQAWAKYKADKRGGAKAQVVHHAKKKSGKPAGKRGGAKMAKTRKAVKRVAHKVRAGLETRPGKVLMMAGTAAAGGMATSFAINNIPKVKDMSQMSKAMIQGGAGLAAIVLGKKKWMKGLGSGAVIAAVFGISKSVLKLDPLAGPGAGAPTLSPAQLRRITGMGVPAAVTMNVPANVSMRGNAPAWGSNGWGSGW
jgi:histidinol dehydrogenase